MFDKHVKYSYTLIKNVNQTNNENSFCPLICCRTDTLSHFWSEFTLIETFLKQ